MSSVGRACWLSVVTLLWCVSLSVAAAAADLDRQAEQRPAAKRKPTPLEETVAAMFNAGLRIGSRHLSEAERHFEQARRLSPNNPWVEYAWGLLLLKQFKREDAGEQFERIRTELEPSFWPA